MIEEFQLLSRKTSVLGISLTFFHKLTMHPVHIIQYFVRVSKVVEVTLSNTDYTALLYLKLSYWTWFQAPCIPFLKGVL